MAVSVTGCFFKNWSYPWSEGSGDEGSGSEGMGLAPVILASDVDWKPPVVSNQPIQPVGWSGLVLGIAAALGFATLVLLLAWRQTARPSKAASGQQDSDAESAIQESLRQMACQSPEGSNRPTNGNMQDRLELQ